MHDLGASVGSVNVGAVRPVDGGGRTYTTAIGKQPVAGRVRVAGVNAAGDDQADRAVHGGPDRALYAYAAEDYAWWAERLERPLAPGTFGENLTLHGVDVSGALIGERWRIGSAELRVTSMRVPCFKLAGVMGDPGFIKAFAQELRPGAYLAIEHEGEIAAGDAVTVTHRPVHGITIRDMTSIFMFEHGRLGELRAAQDDLPPSWREWLDDRLGGARE